MTELVGYDYIAHGLNVTIQTIRVYAKGHRPNGQPRYPDFPKPTNPKEHSPLFQRADADRFITNHPTAPTHTTPSNTPRPDPLRTNPATTVGYDYIAKHLHITLQTAYKYANPNSPQHTPGFPTPINPGNRYPRFKRTDADRFITTRLALAKHTPGRTRAAAALAAGGADAAREAAQILGRPIDLEDRAELRRILFTELQLQPTPLTAAGPSVATAALEALYASQPHPFLLQVLRYRGVTVEL